MDNYDPGSTVEKEFNKLKIYIKELEWRVRKLEDTVLTIPHGEKIKSHAYEMIKRDWAHVSDHLITIIAERKKNKKSRVW